MTQPLKIRCSNCGNELEIFPPLSFSATCDECHSYLRSCLQCSHYDENTRRCSADSANAPRDPSTRSMCDDFKQGSNNKNENNTASDSKAKLNDLFGIPSSDA